MNTIFSIVLVLGDVSSNVPKGSAVLTIKNGRILERDSLKSVSKVVLINHLYESISG